MKRSMLATASLLVIAQCAHADPLKTKTVDLDWACHHVQDLNLGGWHAKRSLICGCLEKGYITFYRWLNTVGSCAGISKSGFIAGLSVPG
jgi:hypothetical protein